jgi:hypothetical protein
MPSNGSGWQVIAAGRVDTWQSRGDGYACDGRPVYGMGGVDGLGGRVGGRETTSADWDGLSGGFSSRFFCQGEGRGFESRRPLSIKHLLSGLFDGRVAGCDCVAVSMVCPWFAHGRRTVRR